MVPIVILRAGCVWAKLFILKGKRAEKLVKAKYNFA
jgi:hypothetical protein